MTDTEETLFSALVNLVAAVAPFGAKHKQSRCYCEHCNTLRRRLMEAAKTVEKFQPPTL